MSFQDKVVIVTGGNSGIGAATVAGFLDAGARVAVFDIRPPPPNPAEQSVQRNDKRLDVTVDVSLEDAAEEAVAMVLRHWGDIDVLCNVAGVMDGMTRVSETETETWERCLKVNVTGPFLLTRACTRHFLSKPTPTPVSDQAGGVAGRDRGTIVNVCSTASKTGAHAGAAYTASKHAILGLGRSTAWMYAKEGIRCNSVLPGGVHTNILANSGYDFGQISAQPGMAALGPVIQMSPGVASAVDVARAIMFCAGNESLNGAELTVDRGWTTI